MFERYTIPARRRIFFTLFDAKVLGSPSIESEHLLLGILHENQALVNRLLDTHDATELIRQRVEARATIREMITTSEDLPLSEECEHVLTNAAEEADRMGQNEIEPVHPIFARARVDLGSGERRNPRLVGAFGGIITAERTDSGSARPG